MWGRNLATSPHEARVRRQEAVREAGMTVPTQPIGSTSERVIAGSSDTVQETDAQKKQCMLEGEALLCYNQIHPLFWQRAFPHIPVWIRGEQPTDPFLSAVPWNTALFIVSQEMVLPDEWLALNLSVDSEQ
eukprot:138592-Rhodomonas_salina.2